MKRNELASTYLNQYEDTDVTITDVATYDGCIAFDLSDGTHWFSDNNDTCRVASSLTDSEIIWDDARGWLIKNEDGSTSEIDWCD